MFVHGLPIWPMYLLLTSAAEAPLVGRPSDHYYNAVGEQVRVTVSARPTDVRVEDDIQFVVHIAGATNAEQIRRPDLRELDEFASRFHIDDLDEGPDTGTARGERTFRYRLRPKNARVTEIPPLLFRYWQPRLNYFAATSSNDSIPLKVRPRETTETSGVPLEEPEFLFQITRGYAVLKGQPAPPPTMAPVLLLIIPGLACFAWYVWWRAFSPGAAEIAGFRKFHAVRIALDELRRIRGEDDAGVSARIAAIVRNYLQARWLLPASLATPSEIARALAQAKLQSLMIERTREFFRHCDAATFGPACSVEPALRAEAENLIETLERHAQEQERTSSRRRYGVKVALLLTLVVSTIPAAVAFADELKYLVADDVANGEISFQAGIRSRGNAANARAQFRQAALHYANMRMKFGVNTVALHRNEGNARILAGDLPGAIIADRRGLALDADDPALNQGLQYARSQVPFASAEDRRRFSPPVEPFQWARRYFRQWGLAASGVFACVGWIGLTRWQMVRHRWLAFVGGFALLTAVTGIAARWVEAELRSQQLAIPLVVTSRPVHLRTGDGQSFPPQVEAPLPAGVEAMVRREWGGWFHVELADGTLGWLPRDAHVDLYPFTAANAGQR